MANYRNLYRIKLGVVRVHGDVVAGAQLAALHAVVPAGVLLGDGDDDEAALAGDHVLLGGELHGVATLGLAVVVPLHLLPGGDLAQAAGQVHALPEVGHQLPLEQRAIAHAGLGPRGVVQQGRVVGPME